jgi:hypothetical protein
MSKSTGTIFSRLNRFLRQQVRITIPIQIRKFFLSTSLKVLDPKVTGATTLLTCKIADWVNFWASLNPTNEIM